MNLLRYLIPVAGRMSPREATNFGQGITKGCGFVAFGPLVVVFDLPAFLRKADPPPEAWSIPTIDYINAMARANREEFNANFPPHN